jgi:hypothetical protein
VGAVAASTALTTGEIVAATAELDAALALLGTEVAASFTALETAIGGVEATVLGLRAAVLAVPDQVVLKVKDTLKDLTVSFVVFRIVVTGDLSASSFQQREDHGDPRYRLGWYALKPVPQAGVTGRGQEGFISSSPTIVVCPTPGMNYTFEYGAAPGFTWTVTQSVVTITLYNPPT